MEIVFTRVKFADTFEMIHLDDTLDDTFLRLHLTCPVQAVSLNLLEIDEGLRGRADDRRPGQKVGDRHPRLRKVSVLPSLDAPAVVFAHS